MKAPSPHIVGSQHKARPAPHPADSEYAAGPHKMQDHTVKDDAARAPVCQACGGSGMAKSDEHEIDPANANAPGRKQAHAGVTQAKDHSAHPVLDWSWDHQ